MTTTKNILLTGIALAVLFALAATSFMLSRSQEKNYTLMQENLQLLEDYSHLQKDHINGLESYASCEAELARIENWYETPVDIQEPLPFYKG